MLKFRDDILKREKYVGNGYLNNLVVSIDFVLVLWLLLFSCLNRSFLCMN